jgi:hypothetical protein
MSVTMCARRRDDRTTKAGFIALAVVVAVAVALVLYRTRTLWFFNDDWDTILRRRSLGVGLFREHNGQFPPVPTAVYQIIIALFGTGSYLPFRIALVSAQASFGLVTFLYLRPRIGNVGGVLGVAFLLFLGAAWEDLLFPYQVGWYIPLLTTVAALLLIDRGTRRADLGACLCMVVGVGSSAVGLPVTVALGLELTLRRAWRRLWIPLVPLGLWGIWHLTSGDAGSGGGGNLSAVGQVPGFVLRIAGTGAGALIGTDMDVGRVVAICVFVAAIAAMFARRAVPPRLVTVLTMPLLFWASVGWTRPYLDGIAAITSRYILPSAVFVLLIIAETLTLARLRSRATAILTVGALVVFAAHSLMWNMDRLGEGRSFMWSASHRVQVRVGALELVRAQLRDRDYLVQEDTLFTNFTAGEYLDAVGALGSLGLSARELQMAVRQDQRDANKVIVDVVVSDMTPAPASLAHGQPAMGGEGVRFEADGPCTRIIPTKSFGYAVVQGSSMKLDLLPQNTSSTVVRLDAFGDGRASARVGIVKNDVPKRLSLPRVRGLNPWTVKLVPSGDLVVCGQVATPADGQRRSE